MGNPREAASQTGTQVAKQILPVRFYGFSNPERIATKPITINPGDFLTHGAEEDTKQQLGAAEVDSENYLYVFRKGLSGWWLRHELVRINDNLYTVPWGKNMKEFEEKRKVYQPSEDGVYEKRSHGQTSIEPGKFSLDVSCEHVVIRSRIQLSFDRIEAYLADEALLKSRGVTIPAGVGETDDSDHAIVYLPDLLSVAEALHAEYLEAISSQQEKMTPLQTKKRLLAGLIQSLTDQEPDLNEKLRSNQVRQYLKDANRSLKKLGYRIKLAVVCHRACITLPGFEATLDDYTGSELYETKAQEFYAKQLKGLVEHPEGLKTLREVAALPDGWAHRLLFSPEGFQFIRKSIAAADAIEEIATPFLLGRAVQYMEQALKNSRSLIHKDLDRFLEAYKRYGRFTAGTVIVVYREPGGGKQSFQITSEDAGLSRGYARNKEWGRRVAALGPPLQKLLLATELINLMVAGQEASQAARQGDRSKLALSAVNLVGSAADSLDAATFLIQKTEAGKAVMASKGGSVALKAAGVVGVVCDYALGVKGAYDASEAGNMWVSTGHGLTALAAVSFGAGMAAKAGLVTTFGVSATVVSGGLLIVGVLLFAGGTFLISYFTDSPIEKYMAQCPWGKESSFTDDALTGITEDKLDDQVQKLLDILWDYDANLTLAPLPPEQPGTLVQIRLKARMVLDRGDSRSCVKIKGLNLYKSFGQKGDKIFIPQLITGRSAYPWKNATYTGTRVLGLEGQTNHRFEWTVRTAVQGNGQFKLSFVFPGSVGSAEVETQLAVQPQLDATVSKTLTAQKSNQIAYGVQR